MMQEILSRLEAENNLRTLPDVTPQGLYLEHDGKRYLNLSSTAISCAKFATVMSFCSATPLHV